MSRNTATRIGTLIGLSSFAALGFALYIAGCANTGVGNDLGLVEPGCRTPSACWATGVDCRCRWVDVFGTSSDTSAQNRVTHPDGTITGCRTCDPTNGLSCICIMDAAASTVSQCIEAQEVCVGRAATTCDGEGARCIHPGTVGSCAMSGIGDPPDRVGTGAGGSIEARCPYVDDVCCPGVLTPDGGTLDGGTLDGGGALDASGADGG